MYHNGDHGVSKSKEKKKRLKEQEESSVRVLVITERSLQVLEISGIKG